MPHPTVDILGTIIHRVDFAQTLNIISDWIDKAHDHDAEIVYAPRNTFPPTHQICTVNSEFIMHARRDPAFAALLRRADLCVPDGVGVLWAARRQGVMLHERVTGSDGIYRICERAAQSGWRIYLLGAAAGVAERAANELIALYPKLHIVGTHSGSPHDRDWPTIQQRLGDARPDILFVAFGHPRQDFWIDEHRHELPATVALGVGGAFDFVAGVTVRAPLLVQRLGLEWLHRLIRQPWRVRRMLALPHFALLVLFSPRKN